jgi:hypothetical protein
MKNILLLIAFAFALTSLTAAPDIHIDKIEIVCDGLSLEAHTTVAIAPAPDYADAPAPIGWIDVSPAPWIETANVPWIENTPILFANLNLSPTPCTIASYRANLNERSVFDTDVPIKPNRGENVTQSTWIEQHLLMKQC